MHIRFLLAASPTDLFSAPSLAVEDRERIPEVGDAYDDDAGSYRAVKVLQDVDPAHGSTLRGAVVYMVRVDQGPSAALRGKIPLSVLLNTASALRACMERAEAARRGGRSEQYRRHIEEFLFLSNTVARLIGPRSAPDPLPYVPVYSENTGLVRLLREGLIETSFAAQVEAVHSLPTLAWVLQRMDPSRPSLFIVTEPVTLHRGIAAIRAIREHAHGADCPILVLAHQQRASDERLARVAGANAYAEFPAAIDQFPRLAERIVALIRPGSERSETRMA